MDKYIDAIISVIKAEGLNPADCNTVTSSLSECVAGDKLIRVYMGNAPRFRDLTYSYENKTAT
tara:strand:+ start:312 stop:500 length:189 start_codon:yes stop_codon:yes gene_type:complete